MKAIICAAGFLALVATAQAQTDTTTAPTATEAPIAAAPVQCPDLPPEPSMPDGAHVPMSSMGAASDAFKAWEDSAHAVLECRRLQYNGVVARLNAVSQAWHTQFTAFCARHDIRCTSVEQSAPQTSMPPSH